MAGGWGPRISPASRADAVGAFWQALTLGAGYNAALVTLGAAALGFAAGSGGSFLVLRGRALVSDAMAHATLPGVALAFMAMVAMGGDGRWLPGLLAGSALSALVGLWVVGWIARATRLPEDAAIGALLGSFFGLGVVLLTVIQTMGQGRAAGLEGFLLGSTAGMLRADAFVIAGGGALVVAAVWALRRPMTLVAFDPGFAAATGWNVGRIDLGVMAIVTAVAVIGLKIVGLVLTVALLVIPAVTARFWTDRSGRLVWIAGGLGAVAGYVGAALSASVPALPTGPIIVLVAAGLFTVSLLAAPARGVLAAAARHHRYQAQVHRRQGLLALARGDAIAERYTLRLMVRDGFARPDGVATDAGRAAAARLLRDEQRRAVAREMFRADPPADDGLMPVERLFTPDQLRAIDARLGPRGAV